MANEAHWSPAEDLKFIVMLREFPILWDTSYPDFTNANKRKKAWESLQKKLNLPEFEIFDLKARLYCYRAGYCEEYSKILCEPFYKPTFLYFNEVKFLFKHDEEQTMEQAAEEEEIICADFDFEDCEEKSHENDHLQNHDDDQLLARDEFTIFGENIAKELKAMDKYKSIKLEFKYKVIAAILEASEARSRLRQYT